MGPISGLLHLLGFILNGLSDLIALIPLPL